MAPERAGDRLPLKQFREKCEAAFRGGLRKNDKLKGFCESVKRRTALACHEDCQMTARRSNDKF
jgi:hypothetical protein